jgi:cobalt/nickel transport system permease protein
MHMADALISPIVGGAMWIASGTAATVAAKSLRRHAESSNVPLMGVMGAFVFAAQMLNFAIPGTGSSGHLGGGLLLAVLLGPEAGLVVIASILAVQALLFADGGLLALGCNIFNMGVLPAFVALPLFRRIVADRWTRPRVIAASILAAQVGSLLGASAVVIETTLSGIASLPFAAFALAMLPIHAAIAVAEGLITASVLLFVQRAQPDLLARIEHRPAHARHVIATLAATATIMSTALCWFASNEPDGLEWSIARVSPDAGQGRLAASRIHDTVASIQARISLLPDYRFRAAEPFDDSRAWGTPDAGASVSGLLGGGITLGAVVAIGLLLRRRHTRKPADPAPATTGRRWQA